MDAREKSARLDLIAFQLGEIEKAAPQAGRGRGAGGDAGRCSPAPSASSGSAKRATPPSTRATVRCSPGWAVSGSGSASWPTIDPQFTPYLEARDGIKSQLEDLALFLRSYGDGVDASPERLQQVEDRLALLERLKRKYGPALQDVIDTGERLRPGARPADRRGAARRGSAAAAGRRPATRYLAVARAAVPAARRGRGTVRRPRSKRCSASWRWRGPGSRSASATASRPGDRGASAASTRREFFLSPNPGEDLRPLARIVSGGELSRVMLALKTLAAAETARQDADLRRGRCRHRRAGRRRRRRQAARARRALPGALHHPPAADRRARHDAVPHREGRARRPDGDHGRAARRAWPGRRDGADDRWRGGHARRSGPARGSLPRRNRLRRRPKADVRAEAKGKREAKGESESRRPWLRNTSIETFGCQMNVHDSERMAGLLDQAGYEPTRGRRATPTSSSSTPAACASTPRTSSTPGWANCACCSEDTGRKPVVAVAGCVAQQEGRRAAQEDQRPRHRRRPRHPAAEDAAGCWSTRRARVGRSRGRHQPVGRRDVSRWGSRGAATRSRPTSPSSKGATTTAPSASCRTRAATSGCAPRPTSSPTSARRSRSGRTRDPPARTDREPLPGAGRSGLRLRRSCWRRSTTCPASSASASPARTRATPARG